MKIKKKSEIKHQFPQGRNKDDYPYSLSDKVFHTKQLFFYSEKVLPGRRASRPHYHRSIDEIIYVLSGQLVAHEGQKQVTLSEGDSICFEANSKEFHFLENASSTEAEFLIFRRSQQKEDVVLDENF